MQNEDNERPYQGIFEAMSDGLILTDGETGLVVEANPAAVAMHGYGRQEFIGLHLATYMHPDSHLMVRRGLATFLKVFDDLELVGEAADGETAVQLCGRVLPDVILMDMVMSDIDGVTATRLIRKRFPTVQVIALTSFKEEGLVQSALQAGAIGYLLKDVLADELAQAIRAAHAGQGTLSPEVVQSMTHATPPPPPDYNLTEREREVLALLVAGLNNSEIAEKLVVSPSTVKSHVSNILAKFGVTSRTEAAATAVRQGLVE